MFKDKEQTAAASARALPAQHLGAAGVLSHSQNTQIARHGREGGGKPEVAAPDGGFLPNAVFMRTLNSCRVTVVLRTAEKRPAQLQAPPEPQWRLGKSILQGTNSALPKQVQASTRSTEAAPNLLCALVQAAGAAGAARTRSALQQPHAGHICLRQHRHRMHLLSAKDNLLRVFGSGFSGAQ